MIKTTIKSGYPGTTLKHTCTDTAQTLSDVTGFVASRVSSGGVTQEVSSVMITVESYDIRMGWGANPTNDSGTAFGHPLYADDAIELTNLDEIRDFRFVNKIAGSNAIIHLTSKFF